VDAKADKATTYTETEVDGLLDDKADKATTYTETEVDGLIATRTESPDETAITGTATFTNSTNNIALTGIGSIGLEIGDVVQVTGTASNNKLFTVEVITDSGNVIVNQAHAGGTTTKSLVNETVSATVTLVSKWFSAAHGLGKGWVQVLSSRGSNTNFTNSLPFLLEVVIGTRNGTDNFYNISISNISDSKVGSINGDDRTMFDTIRMSVPTGKIYKMTRTGGGQLISWLELR
jgi:DNA polymerase II small subunit/DNA polymerase delta subunit B